MIVRSGKIFQELAESIRMMEHENEKEVNDKPERLEKDVQVLLTT